MENLHNLFLPFHPFLGTNLPGLQGHHHPNNKSPDVHPWLQYIHITSVTVQTKTCSPPLFLERQRHAPSLFHRSTCQAMDPHKPVNEVKIQARVKIIIPNVYF